MTKNIPEHGQDNAPNTPLNYPSLGEERAQFLRRIRTALGRTEKTTPPPEPPAVLESIIRLVHSEADLIPRFTENAEAVGMKVCRLQTAALPAELHRVCTAWGIRQTAVSISNNDLRKTVLAQLQQTALAICAWQQTGNLDQHFEVDLGITDVEAALTDSGSIVLRSGPEQSRGTFLIPPIHLAILRASQILPDMLDYWPQFRKSESATPAAATVFVTGPSKTADIEGILITGVHGPGKVHILLLEDA